MPSFRFEDVEYLLTSCRNFSTSVKTPTYACFVYYVIFLYRRWAPALRPRHKHSLFPTASGLFTHFEVYHFILDLINKVFDEYVSPYTYGFSSYFRLSYIFIDISSISTYMYTFLWRAHRSHPTRVAYNPLSPYPTAMVESSFSSWIPNLIFNAPSPMPLYL